MKITSITEGLSPILYHLTSLHGAGQIIATNKFRLSASFSNDSERNTGSTKQYFLSTTRSKMGGYTLRSVSNQSAVLVLDGVGLGQNYAGGPVNYWSRAMINMDNKYDETEDRVYSATPFINDARRYIREVHVLLTKMSLNDRNALSAIKKARVPVFVYDTEEDFLMQRKDQAKPLSHYEMPTNADAWSRSGVDWAASKKQELRRERDAGKVNKLAYGIDRWVEFMLRPVNQWSLMHYSKREYIRSMSYFGKSDAISSLGADLHNAKNKPNEIEKMGKLMRKLNLKTPAEIVDYIIKRWEPALAG